MMMMVIAEGGGGFLFVGWVDHDGRSTATPIEGFRDLVG